MPFFIIALSVVFYAFRRNISALAIADPSLSSSEIEEKEKDDGEVVMVEKA